MRKQARPTGEDAEAGSTNGRGCPRQGSTNRRGIGSLLDVRKARCEAAREEIRRGKVRSRQRRNKEGQGAKPPEKK